MRIWDNRGDDDGAVHGLANGEMIALACGPNLTHFYGPPYSTPNILTLATEYDGHLRDEATREPGAAVWRHESRVQGPVADLSEAWARGQETPQDMPRSLTPDPRFPTPEPRTLNPILAYTEFMASSAPIYVRRFTCTGEGVRWVIRPNPASEVLPTPGGWLIVQHPGQTVLFYTYPYRCYHAVIAQGACVAERGAEGEIIVRLLPGEGSLCLIGASEYPLARGLAERVQAEGVEGLLAATRRYWAEFTARRTAALPADLQPDDAAAQALDDAAILLKGHQAADGGVMVADAFQLAYVRDGYGAARGMLALGMVEEARRLLAYRWAKFARYGTLQTAEALGHESFRHTHENDEVEGTAYTLLQVRDYLAAGGEREFARGLWPMLDWCWRAQLRHLVGGLLPFNGDETYVAGGFYPRSGLNHGSADTSLAFVLASEWLIPWAQAQGFWTSAYAARQAAIAAEARAAWRPHFFAGDHVWANAPERETLAPMPRYRHGVCEGCFPHGGPLGFGWLERNANGRYLCPVCLATRPDLPAAHPGRLEVHSVSLLPAYLATPPIVAGLRPSQPATSNQQPATQLVGLLTPDEVRRLVDTLLARRAPDGHVSTLPGGAGFVGYDSALLLANCLAVGHPATEEVYRLMMGLRDRVGVWIEYYADAHTARPGSSRLRAWETGMSADALARYWRQCS